MARVALSILFICSLQLSVAFQAVLPSFRACKPSHYVVVCSMGLFDGIKDMFNEDAQREREEARQRQLDEQEAIQREMLERRRNPDKMQEYMNDRKERLQKFADDRKVYNFQNKVEPGYDPLTDWKRLREEGKIEIGEDLKRDENSARLGSEGLQEVRVDERMPYIDQGYVEEKENDEGPLGQLFGNLLGKK